MVLAGEMDYSNPEIQAKVDTLTSQLENTSYVTSSDYTESWLRSFLEFYERNNEYINGTIDTEQSFIKTLKENWLFPTNPFSLDVKFNDNGTKIIASRMLIQAVNITDTNHEKVMVQDLRQICKDSPLNVSVFHPYFVFFDQFELIRPTSLQALIIGAFIMMVTSFIFIPNMLCSFWVAFSVISIELGVTGYMALWDVNLDSISMINLIMCIGFSVDFTAHICYTYMASKMKTPAARVRESLYSLGLPILQGSSSTILGVIALLLAQSYIFLVFFKMIFLVIFFGAMHGLFLLPVLLSLFGPGSCSACPEEDDDVTFKGEKKLPVDKQFAHPFYINPSTNAYSGKNYLGAPYKAYDEKDLGIGTSGEDSSESSSSKSQRRQAIEDEHTRRRYEEGWRKSSYQNLDLNSLAQFHPPEMWTSTTGTNKRRPQQQQQFDDYLETQRRRASFDVERDSTDDRSRRKYRINDVRYYEREVPQDQGRHSNSRYHRRRSSDDSRTYRYHQPDSISRKHQMYPPHISNSQHNLYYPTKQNYN